MTIKIEIRPAHTPSPLDSQIPAALRPTGFVGYIVKEDGNEESLRMGQTKAECLARSVQALAEILSRVDADSYLAMIDGADHTYCAEERAKQLAAQAQ